MEPDLPWYCRSFYLLPILPKRCRICIALSRDPMPANVPTLAWDSTTIFSSMGSGIISVHVVLFWLWFDLLSCIFLGSAYENCDLLIKRYYTTRLWIGTPPQKFALIVDTGSTITYVPCSSCEQCGKHQVVTLYSKYCRFSAIVAFYALDLWISFELHYQQ